MTVEDPRLLDAGGTETSLFHTNVQRHKPLIYKETSFDHVLYQTLHASVAFEFREHIFYKTLCSRPLNIYRPRHAYNQRTLKLFQTEQFINKGGLHSPRTCVRIYNKQRRITISQYVCQNLH